MIMPSVICKNNELAAFDSTIERYEWPRSLEKAIRGM